MAKAGSNIKANCTGSGLRRCLLALAVLVFSILAGDYTASLYGQAPSNSQATLAVLEDALSTGERFEERSQWSDALRHYQQSIKHFPRQAELHRRLVTAKAHVDVDRRYSDASFSRSLRVLDHRLAIDVLEEILLKIDTYYVDSPNWNRMCDVGSRFVAVALESPSFLEFHGVANNRARITPARKQIADWAGTSRIQTRRALMTHISMASQYVSRQTGISSQSIVMEFVSGVMASMDRYSAFLTGNQLDETFSQIEGNFVGLGVELKIQKNCLEIVRVIPKGPASLAGIVSGDRIVEVDRQRIGLLPSDVAADMLKGREGSTVDLCLTTSENHTKRLTVTRKRVVLPGVENVHVVDEENGVGYMRIASFQKTTDRDVEAALWKLHRMGMKRLIIDVRGNPGGLLSAGVHVANRFIKDGRIVATRGRSDNEDVDYTANAIGTWSVPLVVLIDGNSASASEIFAGAIADTNRGTIVGNRSFGKGSVQGIFPLSSFNCGIRLTTAKFYSPSGRTISMNGVVPDVVVQQVAKPMSDGTLPLAQSDPVLAVGIKRVVSK